MGYVVAVSLSTPASPDDGSIRDIAGTSARHFPLGGVAIFEGDIDEATRLCVDWIDAGDGGRVATANLDFLALARHNPNLRDHLYSSHLVVADGAPVAWLARAGGASRTRRVGGVDLVESLLAAGTRRGGLRVALYGGEPDVSRATAEAIPRRFPGVNVVAAITPPFRELSAAEEAAERQQLLAAAPELVLVALGCPKQEAFIARSYQVAPQAVWIGVGGTLDILTGRRRRAPRLLQRLGLEWAARLIQEPGRLWRRYLLRDLPVLLAVAPGCFVSRWRPRQGN